MPSVIREAMPLLKDTINSDISNVSSCRRESDFKEDLMRVAFRIRSSQIVI
jgi:hypothetical protein